MSAQSITANPDVVDTMLDGEETVLLHLGTKQYFSLNATGSVVWRGLKKGLEPGAIALELQSRYDVSPERATRSVAALVDALVEQRLVCRADEPQA